METFGYQQMDLKNSAFRLVRLLRGTMSEDVECELIYTTLDYNVIPYEAVSYTWGTSSKECRIKVQGLDFMVTSNLWNLLRDLRQSEADRYLWIDAISINQDDNLERGHQVRQMRQIYSGAERVLCYVGQTSESIDIFMKSLVTFQKNTLGYRWAPNDSRWQLTWERAQFELQLRYGNDVAAIQKQGLHLLLERPWFRRVWVLQEVASARRASLCCGRNSIPVQIFSAGISVLNAGLDRHSMAVLELMPTYSRKTLRKTRHRDLCQILVDFHRSEASEPRDKIFALLGLCADQSVWEAVVPDYTQTESALVCTTITYIMTKSLDAPFVWTSSDCPPSIHLFLDDLANTFKYAPPMNNTQGRIDENTHAADTAPLDRPNAFEMMSLVLKYYHNKLGHWPSIISNSWSRGVLYRVFSLRAIVHNYLLNRLKIMREMPVRSLRDAAVLNWRKEVYRFISLMSGPCLIDVESQAFRTNLELEPDQSSMLQSYQSHLIYLNNLISGSDFISRAYRDSILRYYRENFKTPVLRIDFLFSDSVYSDLLSAYGEDLLSRRRDDTRDFISGQDDLIFGSDLVDFISRAYRYDSKLRAHLTRVVIQQVFIKTRFMHHFAPTWEMTNHLEEEVSTMLRDLPRSNSDGFEDWALFTMAVLYGRMWTRQGLLVKKPAGFDQGSMCDALALYCAINFQHELTTRHLLEKGVKIVIGRLPNPLSLAVHHKNSAILEVLRAHHTNVVGYDGRLPLHCAVELETIPVIRFLLEQGADPDAVDRDGRTALQVAKDSGRFGVACLLETVRDGILDDRCAEAAEAVELLITMNELANWLEECAWSDSSSLRCCIHT
ncbi:hypothetical protein FHL15_007154 [Xylaria flabelliformis]|uniref:Heterokaryon incompatibility domain-containing protein n=1 Tax=Xylaria flabelliformis TaxID=2512241 RepID=A0A553HVU6_9PEZI|nr:hypothetical protein FHL15_007154 [Xylaria flabelliformis]